MQRASRLGQQTPNPVGPPAAPPTSVAVPPTTTPAPSEANVTRLGPIPLGAISVAFGVPCPPGYIPSPLGYFPGLQACLPAPGYTRYISYPPATVLI